MAISTSLPISTSNLLQSFLKKSHPFCGLMHKSLYQIKAFLIPSGSIHFSCLWVWEIMHSRDQRNLLREIYCWNLCVSLEHLYSFSYFIAFCFLILVPFFVVWNSQSLSERKFILSLY